MDELDFDLDLEELELDFDLDLEELELDFDLDLEESESDLDFNDAISASDSSELYLFPPHFEILYSFMALLFSRHFSSISESGDSPSSPNFYSHLCSLVKN